VVIHLAPAQTTQRHAEEHSVCSTASSSVATIASPHIMPNTSHAKDVAIRLDSRHCGKTVCAPHSHDTRYVGSRAHDREEDLQAASGKIGGHLFEAHIQLIAHASPQAGHLASERLRQMAALSARSPNHAWRRFTWADPTRRIIHPRGRGVCCRTRRSPPSSTADRDGRRAQMQMMEFRELEPPAHFHAEIKRDRHLGRVLFRDDAAG